jgi:magnesium chelatase family protein
VWLARAGVSVRWPARALVIAAMNPCPCGWLGHPRRGCRCTPAQHSAFAARVSGPVLDRLDLQIEVPALTGEELDRTLPGETSAAVRSRLLAARERQRARGVLNSALPPARLREECALGAAARKLTRDAVDRGGFSARGIARALRVARTIADLAGEAAVSETALAEALQYRAYEARRSGAA